MKKQPKTSIIIRAVRRGRREDGLRQGGFEGVDSGTGKIKVPLGNSFVPRSFLRPTTTILAVVVERSCCQRPSLIARKGEGGEGKKTRN